MRFIEKSNAAVPWDFICTSTDAAEPGRTLVTLRNQTGQSITLPLEDFQLKYELLGKGGAGDADVIKETLALIKHHSTLRFVALALALGAAATLAKEYGNGPFCGSPVLLWAGLLLSIVGTIFEVALSRNLICFWLSIGDLIKGTSWDAVFAHRSSWVQWIVRLTLLSPHLAFVYFWFHQALGQTAAFVAIAIALAAGCCIWRMASRASPG